MRPTELLLDPGLRTTCAALLVSAYLLVCGMIAWREHRQLVARSGLALAAADSPVWLIAYASQTGVAEALALASAQYLHLAGMAVQVCALGQVTVERLQAVERVLFVASTAGEGDAPDNAAHFAAQLMQQTLSLSHLHYAVLALGDSSYSHYCGFGRRLSAWLAQCDAQPLFPGIEIDREEPQALAVWQHQLQHLAGSSDMPDWAAPAFQSWRLVRRECLNPGSAGTPLHRIELLPVAGALPEWEAGDLVQIAIPPYVERPREYSIASLPDEGRLHLLVRLQRGEDGGGGLASGWLTQTVVPGDEVRLRLRPHRLFRLGENAGRPMILIGNGSGLAGLRCHLKAREQRGEYANWLIFGERNMATDMLYADELSAWQGLGVLRRLDRVFSRDGKAPRYVQEVLRASASEVRAWVDAGAAIYLCGSLQGMAAGVDEALQEVLGAVLLAQLKQSGRYRRDVY